jgi:hypothetical protein
VRGCIALLACLGVVACSGSGPTDDDVCKVAQRGAAGSVEIGHGSSDYVPVIEGETFQLELGLQGLWMFILSARANGMDISDGETAAIWFNAIGPGGEIISLDSGCREREFAVTTDGALELTDPYFVAVLPEHTGLLSGDTISLEVIVRDAGGHEATSITSVVAQLPQ